MTHWNSKDSKEQRTRSETYQQAHSGGHPPFIIGSKPYTYGVRINSRAEGNKI